MPSHLDQEYSLGRQRSKPQLHNQPLKQNMWQPLKQQVGLYGSEEYSKIWEKNKVALLQLIATINQLLQ